MSKTAYKKSAYKYGFSTPEISIFKTKKGIDSSVVRAISLEKNEDKKMLNFRLRAYQFFINQPLPSWGPNLSDINFDDIYYYLKPTEKESHSWSKVPAEIKNTYDKLGVPEIEKQSLGGIKAQYESEVVYGSLMKKLQKKGVIFCGMDEAFQKYPKILWQYFGKLVPPDDNKLASLNSAVWSGGSFIYVPKNVKVDLPLQTYFRINSQKMGQFERTLIIADEGSSVHYIEGCTAPIYSTNSLHSAVVEVFVKKNAHVRYTTIQNWSTNVYNLVTKRAKVGESGTMEWVDGNLGSKITMKYPSNILIGKNAHAEVLSIAVASGIQYLDTGAKAIHLAPNTTSRIISKSISLDGGRSSYRGTVYISQGATNSRSKVVCDALILDKNSRSDTYPVNKNYEKSAILEHEATVSKIGKDQLFYLMSRGFSESESEGMIVNGFINPILDKLPIEYSLELNRLINLQLEGNRV